jgi:hypothetical protein
MTHTYDDYSLFHCGIATRSSEIINPFNLYWKRFLVNVSQEYQEQTMGTFLFQAARIMQAKAQMRVHW